MAPDTATEAVGLVTGTNANIFVERDQIVPRNGITLAGGTLQINRKRLKELFALAYETVEWLEKKGLKKGEQCEFREIAERLWWKD